MADVLPSIRITDPARPEPPSPSKSESDSEYHSLDVPREEAYQALELPNSPSSSTKGEPRPVNADESLRHHANLSASKDGERPLSSSSIDPLSQHILYRTRPAPGHQKSRSQAEGRNTTTADNFARESAEPRPSTDGATAEVSSTFQKDKKKGVSFFARFMGNKKKDFPDSSVYGESEAGDERPEGAEVQAYRQPVDNIEFNPRHPQPPPYIKVRSKYKKERDFQRVFLSQELRDARPCLKTKNAKPATGIVQQGLKSHSADARAIWALEFSKDGRFLASAGQDQKVRVWAVIASHEDRRAEEIDEANGDDRAERGHLNAPVFQSKPRRVFTGHEGPILDLTWSKNNFLLSSSMDKTVRLWHVSRDECLCAFKHSDFVTSIQFHPQDDRFFLAGSLDSKLRLWSIPDKSVGFWTQLPDMVTAVSFTPDGKQAIGGCLSGLCLFYETEGLKYQTQIHVKSTHGKNAKGSKITGIRTIPITPALSHIASNSDVKVLITSNDSRIRLYNLRDKSLEMKFRGHTNMSSQIHARFSDDARFIISGSEDKRVFIWSTQSDEADLKKNKWPVEMFEAHNAAATASILAPARTRQLLGFSEDPIYDLCNPPPVTLVSKSEAANGSPPSTSKSDKASDHRLSPNGSLQHTPKNAENGGRFPSPADSPAYLVRSLHVAGHIIITADSSGAIKVFRQDCPAEKRRASDLASDISSIKRASSGLIRKASVANSTRSQRSTTSRQSAQQAAPAAPGNLSRERIMTWRQSISGSTRSLPRTSMSSISPSLRDQNRSASPWKRTPLLGSSPRSVPPKAGTPPPPGLAISNAGSFDSRKDSLDTASSSASRSMPPPPHPSTAPQRQRSLGTSLAGGAANGTNRSSTTSVSSSNPASPSPGPPLNRETTAMYWGTSAWHDQFAEQLRNSRGLQQQGRSRLGLKNQSKSRDASEGPSTDGGTSSLGDSERNLMPPAERGLSGISALSSAAATPEGSGDEGGSGGGGQGESRERSREREGKRGLGLGLGARKR